MIFDVGLRIKTNIMLTKILGITWFTIGISYLSIFLLFLINRQSGSDTKSFNFILICIVSGTCMAISSYKNLKIIPFGIYGLIIGVSVIISYFIIGLHSIILFSLGYFWGMIIITTFFFLNIFIVLYKSKYFSKLF